MISNNFLHLTGVPLRFTPSGEKYGGQRRFTAVAHPTRFPTHAPEEPQGADLCPPLFCTPS